MLTDREITRRAALLGLGAGAFAGTLDALQHAHRQLQNGTRVFSFFASAEASEVETLSAAILPSGETPGAKEAGVIFFIDRALATFDAEKGEVFKAGLQATRQKCRELFPRSTSLAELTPTDCTELVRAIETTEFFEQLRTYTVIGFLATPEWGGNRDQVGWKLIGFEDHGVFQPPFGYYDAAVETR